jgi:molybdopterin-guanine dinucleotide biosynthesis protein A
MGRDKGLLQYHGEPQVVRVWKMLAVTCGTAYVSVRAAQAELSPYAELPLIVDEESESLGPAAGLLAAWEQRPQAAWLVLATDLPFVDTALLNRLVDRRDPGCLATAFRHADGVPEPLCAIWEPRARLSLIERARSGDRSLRRLLTSRAAALIDAEDSRRLASVDVAAEYDEVLRQLTHTGTPS